MKRPSDFINDYRKDSVYTLYTILCPDIKPYDKISRRQMKEAIYEIYRTYPDIFFHTLLADEWETLFEHIKNKTESERDFPGSYAPVYFLIATPMHEVGIPKEILPMIKSIRITEAKRKADRIIHFFIGLARIHGIIKLTEAYEIFRSTYPDMTYEQFAAFPQTHKRIMIDVDNKAYENGDLIISEDCYLSPREVEDYERKHVYTFDEYVSVSKYWANLEDPTVRNMYKKLEQSLSDRELERILSDTWTFIGNNRIPSEPELLQALIDIHDEPQDALDIFNHYMSILPRWHFKGDPGNTIEIRHEPPKPKTYQKYDPCPCGSGMKHKFCCLNWNLLLKNRAILENEDIMLLYELIVRLVYETNQEIGMYDTNIAYKDFFTTVPRESFVEIKKYVFEHKEHIETFIRNHFDSLTSDELDAINDFRRAITDRFVAVKYQDQKLVLISTNEKDGYVVSGITDPISLNIDTEDMPMFVETTLIPYRGRIVYALDFIRTPIRLGPNIQERIDQVMKNVIIHETL